MAISIGGINTGLPPNLVDQLIEAEKLPIKNLQNKKAKIETKLGLVNNLDEKLKGVLGTLGQLTSTKGFTDMSVTSGDPNIITGSADPDAVVNGNWNVEVMQLASKASALTNGFPDKDKTQIGVGYLKFKTAEGTKEVYINGGNNTLERVAATINSSGLNLQASVIKDSKDHDAPYRLMVSGIGVGEDNTIDYPTIYLLDGDQDLYFDEERKAQDGKIKIDGFEVSIDENKLKDVIPGVTLDLKQASPGKTINVGVAENKEVVSGKIKDFVDKMNEALSFIQGQNRLNENVDTTKTLGGDSMIRTVENDLRVLVQSTQMGVGGQIKTLNQLGITFNRNGTLDLNQEKFNKVLAESSSDVRSFFVGDGFNTGFVSSVRNTINRITNASFGPIGSKRRSFQQQIQTTDQRIENMTRNLDRKEVALRRKFANLEETMSRLNSQGSALAARMGTSMSPINLGGASVTGGIGS